MGWIISTAMLLVGCFNNNDILVVTSGLYAIAGAISTAASAIRGDVNGGEKENKNE